MEMSQGNKCIAILNKNIILFVAVVYKNREYEGRTGSLWGAGTRMWGEGVGG
jgi:hypothetical protein